jgi:hypothetical protein
MPQNVEHDGNIDRAQLETNLRFNEGLWRKLTAIKVEGSSTISTHDDSTKVPVDSLVLVEEDAQGNAPAPAGSAAEPFCKGEAMIGGVKKKVRAYRKN